MYVTTLLFIRHEEKAEICAHTPPPPHPHTHPLPWSSSRAMWIRALFLMLLTRLWSLSWQALRLASVLAELPSSRSRSQYQAQPSTSHITTFSSARHRPMHSSAFPWQLQVGGFKDMSQGGGGGRSPRIRHSLLFFISLIF